MNGLVDIVCVNWNAGRQLEACIESVVEHGRESVQRIIVVDNGSSDGSDASVARQPKVVLVRAGYNMGFAKACNFGARSTNSEYLLFLNPDAAINAETLTRALSFMREPNNSRVGICGVQLCDKNGAVSRTCSRFPSATNFVAHAIGLTRLIPGIGYIMSEWDHEGTRQVDHVMGAFFLVRHEVFDALGGFDERFFVYLEDMDFSYRAFQAGWLSAYIAEAQAFHAGGGTSGQVKAKRLFYSLRSRLLYAFKHFSWFGAFGVLMATLLIEPLSRSTLAIFRRSFRSLQETWSGFGMLWRWLPRWVFKGVMR